MGLHINPESRIEGIDPIDTRIRRRKIDGMFAERHAERTVGLQDELDEHILERRHEPAVVGVRLVQLEFGKLGIVRMIHPFIAKKSSNFVHFRKPTYEQSFQVQFWCHPEIEVDIQGVEVRREGPGGRAAGNALQNWRLHVKKPKIVEEASHMTHDAHAGNSHGFHFLIHQKIQITLSVPYLDIGQAMPFFGQRTKCFGEKPQRLRSHNGTLATVCQKKFTGYLDEISHIKTF